MLKQTIAALKANSLYSIIIIVLLVTRFISEILSNFLWDDANYVWSALCLICIGIFSWMFFISDMRKERSIFTRYLPIFLYLFFLFLRVDYYDVYSIKCFFSEFLVWGLFVYTVDITNHNLNNTKAIEAWIILLIKIIVLIALTQLALCITANQTVNPLTLFNLRPVRGIFAHQNIFLVVTLPFLFYFLKNRQYKWIPLLLIACIFTGTRAPFLAMACMPNLILKSILRRNILWKDIIFTFVLFLLIYGGLIWGFSTQSHESSLEQERLGTATLEWRIEFWKNFAQTPYDFSTFIGHGVGAADTLAADLVNRDIFYPHNDFLRMYYDTGILGLLFFLSIIFFMLRLIQKTICPDTDFILLSYMVIICFYITDNFIYCTHSIFLYLFIAIFLIDSGKAPKNIGHAKLTAI